MSLLAILLLVWNFIASFCAIMALLGTYHADKNTEALKTWVEFFWGMDFDKVSEWISHDEWKEKRDEERKKEMDLLEKIREDIKDGSKVRYRNEKKQGKSK